MIDPKVRALRTAYVMIVTVVVAGAVTQSQALAELHHITDQLWPPAVFNGKVATP